MFTWWQHQSRYRCIGNYWFLLENAEYKLALCCDPVWMGNKRFQFYFYSRCDIRMVTHLFTGHLWSFNSWVKLSIPSFNSLRYFLIWFCNSNKDLLEIEKYVVHCYQSGDSLNNSASTYSNLYSVNVNLSTASMICSILWMAVKTLQNSI